MKYKLALKLKKAGFPPISHRKDMKTGSFCTNCEWDNYSNPQGGIEDFCYPTLSELMEACGDRFYALQLNDDGKWICTGKPESTPEIAVANLWLALNNK